MKSVLISIQPYWVFLIIAKIMCWNVDKQKTVEVRKNYPKDQNWDNNAKIYCSKDKKSFSKIPKEYQPFMKKFLGKVIGEFVCDKVFDIYEFSGSRFWLNETLVNSTCLTEKEIHYYGKGKDVYGWHISDLVIYDKPRELSGFLHFCEYDFDEVKCIGCKNISYNDLGQEACDRRITRPPQSWCYVEEVQNV